MSFLFLLLLLLLHHPSSFSRVAYISVVSQPAGPSNILQMENVALDPSPSRNTTVDLHLLSDDNMTSSLTFDTNSTMTFNISDYGSRMEVTSVKLIFTFNVEG